MQPHRVKERGFTLLEILVVVAIIGIVATLLLTVLANRPKTVRVGEFTKNPGRLKAGDLGVFEFRYESRTDGITTPLADKKVKFFLEGPTAPPMGRIVSYLNNQGAVVPVNDVAFETTTHVNGKVQVVVRIDSVGPFSLNAAVTDEVCTPTKCTEPALFIGFSQ